MNTSEHNNTGTVTISVRTSRETKEQLETLAESMGRSTNYVAGEALTIHFRGPKPSPSGEAKDG
jgi:hypothetical protein